MRTALLVWVIAAITLNGGALLLAGGADMLDVRKTATLALLNVFLAGGFVPGYSDRARSAWPAVLAATTISTVAFVLGVIWYALVDRVAQSAVLMIDLVALGLFLGLQVLLARARQALPEGRPAPLAVAPDESTVRSIAVLVEAVLGQLAMARTCPLTTRLERLSRRLRRGEISATALARHEIAAETARLRATLARTQSTGHANEDDLATIANRLATLLQD